MLLKLLVWFIQFSPFTKRWFWKKWYTLFPKLAPDTEFKCMNFGFFSENVGSESGRIARRKTVTVRKAGLRARAAGRGAGFQECRICIKEGGDRGAVEYRE